MATRRKTRRTNRSASCNRRNTENDEFNDSSADADAATFARRSLSSPGNSPVRLEQETNSRSRVGTPAGDAAKTPRQSRVRADNDENENAQTNSSRKNPERCQRVTSPCIIFSEFDQSEAAKSNIDVSRLESVLDKLVRVVKVLPEAKAVNCAEASTDALVDEVVRRVQFYNNRTPERRRAESQIDGVNAYNALSDILQAHIKNTAGNGSSQTNVNAGAGTSRSTSASRSDVESNRQTMPTINENNAAQSTSSGYQPFREQSTFQTRYPSMSYSTHQPFDAKQFPIPKFDGKNWQAFKSVFESVSRHCNWDPEAKALHLKCLITGSAQDSLEVVDSSDWTYEQLVEHFELRHGRYKSKVEVMIELHGMARKPTQSVTAWRDEVITVANTGSLTRKQYREITYYNFLRGLETFPQMLSWVGEHDKTETLQSCYEWAQRYEREVGTPSLLTTRPKRQTAIVNAVETRSIGSDSTLDQSDIATQASHQAAFNASNDPVLQAMAKASKETNELIEKLQTELAAVKRQTNNYNRGGWRGRGRGRGRGNGRGGFQNYQNDGEQNRTDAAVKRTVDGTPVSSNQE